MFDSIHGSPQGGGENNLKYGDDFPDLGESMDVELLDVAEAVHVEAHRADEAH